MIHPDIVFTNNEGDTFTGLVEYTKMAGRIFQLEESRIRSQNTSAFINAAIVNTNEWRSGTFLG